MVVCFQCGKKTVTEGIVGRLDSCDQCGTDLHVCLNCRHYDTSAYNECRETQAERVLEKDRSNFCDYFSSGEGGPGKVSKEKEDAKSKLDALFKKK